MKIGYVMQQGAEVRQPPYDGPANHVRHVVAELQSRGHQVRVLTSLDGILYQSDDLENFIPVSLPQRAPLFSRLFERGVRRIQSSLRLPYAAWFESRRFAELCCHALADYDLLYERMSWMGYGAGLAAQKMHKPLILEFNGDHLHDLEAKGMAPRGLQRRLSMALMQQAVNRASYVIASGRGWHAAFLKRYRYAAERISTIENGTVLVQQLSREDLRAFCAPQHHTPITIAYLGSFYPWHGVEILLRAFANLRTEGLDIRLILIGAGANFQSCQQLAQELGIAAEVQFVGQLPAEEYGPVLAGADIGVSPYCGWKEFSGMKLFDYKAAGLAIAASGENGQPDTLVEDETGLIVPPCDQTMLENAVRKLVTDGELRRRLGRAARIDAEKHHGWDHTVDQIEAIFARLTRESHDSR